MANYEMEQFILSDVTDKYILKTDTTLSKSGVTADAKKVGDEISALKEDLTQKANQDGYYADLVSGGATQILSDMVETDTTPYNYRTAGGSLEIGDREKLKKIVGVSLPVNQLINGSINFSATGGAISTTDGIGAFTPSASGQQAYKSYANTGGHKYFASATARATTANANIKLRANANDSTDTFNSTNWKTICVIYPTSSNGNLTVGVIDRRESDWDTIYVKDFTVIDLTAMFGTTIADYVYSLEIATAGAGVAWLKAHFPRIFDAGYIPYNAGSMEHVSGLSAHKMVGFNQWDEETESGFINDSGQNSVLNTALRSKSYIVVIPGATYYVNCPKNIFVFYYDSSKNFISKDSTHGSGGNLKNESFVIPQNAYFMRFCMYDTSTYNHDICINLHWDGERDGEYEPYEEHSYPLDSDVTLRGIYKLDANNNLYAYGDTYESDGTVNVIYVEKVLDGSNDETWSTKTNISNAYSFEDASIANNAGSVNVVSDIRCSKYAVSSQSAMATAAADKAIAWFGWGKQLVIRDSAYESLADFKNALALNPITVVYPIATPTTETADPYTEIQNVSNWGTEEFVSESLVPVGHVTEYQPDLRAKVEVAPESPDVDGLYLMKRENGQNSYVAYLGELPSDPTTDGTYTLKCTVASGVATKTWEADT